MNRIHWIGLLLLLYSSIASAQEQGYPIIKNYTPETYKQSPQVFSVTKDYQGWMYFGINGQVMMYDGSTWSTTPIPNQSSVYSVIQGPDSTIYVGATGDFGLLVTENHEQVYQSLSHLLPENEMKFTSIWQIVVHQGDIYFRSFEAIFRYRPSPQPSIKVFHRQKDSFFGGLISYKKHLYVYHHEIGMQEVGENELMGIPQTSFFEDKRFYVGFHHTSDSLLIVTRNHGCFLVDPISNTPPQPLLLQNPRFLEQNDIYAAGDLGNGMIGMLSISKGAYVVDSLKQPVQLLNQEVFMQSNYARQCYAEENHWWITSNTGIDKVDANFDLSYWNKNNGLNDLVETIVRHQGQLYIGTQQGTYRLTNNYPVLVEGIPAGQTWALKTIKLPNQEEVLLAGTSKGIFKIEGTKAHPLVVAHNHSTANVLYQSRIDPKRIYTTAGKYLLSIYYKEGKWLPEKRYEALLEDIRGIAEDKNGNLWLGSFRNGLVKVIVDSLSLEPVSHRYYGVDSGFPSLKDIKPFHYKDSILFGTSFGLYHYKQAADTLVPYCGLGNQFCGQRREVFSFQEMADGKIWILPLMTQEADIGYLDTSKDSNQWVFKPFRRIPKMMMRGFYAEPNGIVWFGGEKGVYRYDANMDMRNYQASFNAYIKQLFTGDDSLIYNHVATSPNTDHLFEIPYDQNTVRLTFTAPFFDQEDQTVYRYRLSGLEEQWSDWERQTSKEYHYLQEGDYTFELQAQNIYGVKSPTTHLSFSLHPPWFRTNFAYAMYVLLVFIGLWALIRFNTYRITKEKEALEIEVQKRTLELTKQKNALEKQKGDILTKNSEILLQKEEIETQADNLRNANKYISVQKEEVEKHLKHLAAIVKIGQEVTSSFNLENTIEKVYQHINTLMPATEFGIGFYQEKSQLLDFKLLMLKGKRIHGYASSLKEKRLSSWVVKHKKPIWLQNTQEQHQEFIPSLDTYTEGALLASVICLPLVVEKRVIGVMSVQSDYVDAYNSYHFDLLQALSAYVAIALDNSNAYEQLNNVNRKLEETVEERTKQIQKAFNELLTAHEQLDYLTYRSAHDLRGPVARLEGLCQVAKLESTEPKSISYFSKIAEEANQMDQLLTRIMLTQNIKTKDVKPEPVFLDNMILNILKSYKPFAQANDIKISFKRITPIRVFSDYALIEHLMTCVIDNAFKFNNARKEKPFVKVIATEEDTFVEVRVIDNGIGVLQESKQQIFDMFFVGNQELRGYGLGLFDALIVAEKLKGSIKVANRSDHLTEFIIILPKKAIFLHWAQMIS